MEVIVSDSNLESNIFHMEPLFTILPLTLAHHCETPPRPGNRWLWRPVCPRQRWTLRCSRLCSFPPPRPPAASGPRCTCEPRTEISEGFKTYLLLSKWVKTSAESKLQTPATKWQVCLFIVIVINMHLWITSHICLITTLFLCMCVYVLFSWIFLAFDLVTCGA